MKKNSKTNKHMAVTLALAVFMLAGCGAGPYSGMQEPETTDIADVSSEESADVAETTDENLQVAQPSPYVENENESDETESATEDGTLDDADEETEDDSATEEYLPGYATEQDYRNRHTGSASHITDRTVIVSIFVDEEEDVWTQDEKDYAFGICDTAYTFLDEYLESNYDADVDLIYDWKTNPDLVYSIRVFEDIPAYVSTEEEHHMDELEDEWVAQVPVQYLCEKYETTSIAFLYLIPHEGCSYSSMHFVEDTEETWNEGCLLYLQDMYSPTYEYETPTVFAHELLHLFGAEDYYASAEVFSKETYKKLAQMCADDIMLHTFDKINGVYTTYPGEVRGEITPVTAYLIGIYDESAVEEIPELIREEEGVFPGSTYDRPF